MIISDLTKKCISGDSAKGKMKISVEKKGEGIKEKIASKTGLKARKIETYKLLIKFVPPVTTTFRRGYIEYQRLEVDAPNAQYIPLVSENWDRSLTWLQREDTFFVSRWQGQGYLNHIKYENY